MDNDQRNDLTDFLLVPFRLLNFWNTSRKCGTSWLGRTLRFMCNLTILVIVVNLLGGFALSMLIEWTDPPYMPSSIGSLELVNEVQFEEWESRKQYWMDTFHVNLEDVNKTCRELNQNWTSTNLYWREKFFEYWNKINWEPVVKERMWHN